DVQLREVETELANDTEDLAREGFVDLPEIDVLLRDPGSFESETRRGRRAEAHQLRLTADDSPGDQPAERLLPLAPRVLCGGDDDGGRAVDDSRRIAGRDLPVLPEGGGQIRERFDRGVRPHVVVPGHADRLAAGFHVDPDDLF